MNIIEFIHKLSELGRLVELIEKPYLINSDVLQKYGFEYLTEGQHLLDDDGDIFYTAKRTGYFYSNGWSVILENLTPEEAWNHEITQQAFKAKVRKVAGELMEGCKLNKQNLFVDYSNHSFDDLFARFLGENAKGTKYDVLKGICHKLEVELEVGNE